MFGRSKQRELEYEQAVMSCEIATQRLRCINRELTEDQPKGDLPNPTVKDRIRVTFMSHLLRCEGVEPAV